MIKKNLKKLIISSVVILLPILVGLLLWDKLPDRVASHWGVDGQVDGWTGKFEVIFALPLIMVAVQWLCVWITAKDPKNQKQTEKAFTMVLWIIPTISLLCSGMIYGVALGWEPNVDILLPMTMGAMFLFLGNYLPKCKCNHTIGIKLPWTVYNEENWNATHRLGGKVWVIGGIVMMLCGFLPGDWGILVFLAVLIAAALIPVIYSYAYYRRQLQAGMPKIIVPASSKWMTLVMMVLLAAVLGWVFTGSITVEYQDRAFVIQSDRYDDLTVSYDVIDIVEYREEQVSGSREWGFGSPTLLMGSFKNEEFGMFTRYTYTSCSSCVVVTAGEKILVLNGPDEAATRAIYETLKEKIG